jgi:negative regulator of flagellin synthesis FlgM
MQIKDPLGINSKSLERKDQAGTTSRVSRGEESSSGDSSTQATGDRVQISGKSREMARAAEVASGASDVRAEKISEIKERVDNNQYEVDADKVAHKMIVEFLGELV